MINNKNDNMHKKRNTKNILVICHSYNSFVKDWVDAISVNFNQVYVFVRYNTFFDIIHFFRKEKYIHKSLDYKISCIDKPLNVNIVLTQIFYLPIDFFFKKAGNQHLQSVIEEIEQLNIHFDLIHAHFTWTSGYVAAKLKEMYDVPAVVTAHGFDIYDLPFRDTDWTFKISSLLNHVDYIITVSQKNLEKMTALNIRTPKTVIQNGYSPALFKPMDVNACRKKLQLTSNKKFILTVGHLTKIKGHKYLIEAMSILSQECNDVVLIIIGGGPLLHQLESQIKELGLKDNVILKGPKAHCEIPYWIGACDLFVLSSLNEGNPTVMFEALGCGRPFVGTKVGGIPDVIINERLGIVVEPSDSFALAKAISRSLNIKWDYGYIADYSKKYTWSNIVQKTMSIYDTLL